MKSCIPPIDNIGKIAIAITIIPIPPNHCKSDLHNKIPYDTSSKLLITVEPVVVIPEVDTKIAMYCTGGIRCEKASYYMKEIGFNNIFQLEGGILKYIEDTPETESLWDGECFVFDKRVTVNSKLEKGTYDLCHGCNEPISKTDQESIKFEKDVSCPNCYEKATENKKNKSRERSKQISLSQKRKTPNVYLPKAIEEYY